MSARVIYAVGTVAQQIRRLDQIKAIADPLRLRILEALGDAPRTPMQVAELLDRKPTSLYHHLHVLEAAGLIRQTETRKKRGTVERHYQAVSTEVRVDPRAFASRKARGPSAILATVARSVEQDIDRLSAAEGPMIGLRLNVTLPPSRLPELEAVVQRWAASVQGPGARAYALAVMAYPRPHATGPRRGMRRAGRVVP
jgi:DNA-binding transcriptional ArsR family regulator